MYHGIINVYKEPGYTSHDVVARLRGILKQKKIGHTGTLDPAAEGVLPVCLGMGTRLCDMLADRTKTYEAVLLLGCSTDTQDTTGTILTENREKALALDPETAEKVILGFKGDYDQIPPHVFRLKGGREKALRPGPCRKGSGAEGQKSTDSGDFHLKYGASQGIHPGYLLQRHLHTNLVRRYRKRTGHRGMYGASSQDKSGSFFSGGQSEAG